MINSQDDDFDEEDELNNFFNLMCHFNNEQEYKPEFRAHIENFFEYMWINDKTNSIKQEVD